MPAAVHREHQAKGGVGQLADDGQSQEISRATAGED